jgi:rhamnulokinase
MTEPMTFLAFDLGASSGRAVSGSFSQNRMQLKEIHRFANCGVRLPNGLHWDVLFLWSQILEGLRKGIAQDGSNLRSIGVDSWGVDFALLDRRGALTCNPYCYRDDRTDGMMEEAFKKVSKRDIFFQTGIQFMQINGLYQLLSMVIHQSPELEIARTLLTIPDLFNYWFSGEKVCEFTNATTMQCYNGQKQQWAYPLLSTLHIPTEIFPEVIPPATIVGKLLPQITRETGGDWIQLVAPACHDTGSAVAAVPATNKDFVYISSGTWSLMGAELPTPLISDKVLELNFTNEGGVGGSSRFLKNIAGLWIVQECKRTWGMKGENYSWDELISMAEKAQPFASLIDPDCPDFLKPGDMPERIQKYCQRTGQMIPEGKGAVIRCALESLAIKYRFVFNQLEDALGKKLEPIHIIGGGSKNQLLNQFTANATHRRVIAGPDEATAAGNIMVQWLALKLISSVDEGRAIIRDSFELRSYDPREEQAWDDAYQRLLKLMNS